MGTGFVDLRAPASPCADRGGPWVVSALTSFGQKFRAELFFRRCRGRSSYDPEAGVLRPRFFGDVTHLRIQAEPLRLRGDRRLSIEFLQGGSLLGRGTLHDGLPLRSRL